MYSFIIYSECPTSPPDIIPHPSLQHDRFVHIADAPTILYNHWDQRSEWDAMVKYLITDPYNLYNYIRIMQYRCPRVEAAICHIPELAYRYSYTIIRGRWPEVEPVVLTDVYYAYCYAVDVIKARWPEAEPIIKSSPLCHIYGMIFGCVL